MSDFWHYRCTECGERSEDKIYDGRSTLRALAPTASALAALFAGDGADLILLRLRHPIRLASDSHDGPTETILGFLARHGSHQLELVSEHGEAAPIDEPCPAVFPAVPGVTCDRQKEHHDRHEAWVEPGGPMRHPWTVRWW